MYDGIDINRPRSPLLMKTMRMKRRRRRSQGNSIFYSVFIGLTVGEQAEQAKKKPTPAAKKTATKTKPAAKPVNGIRNARTMSREMAIFWSTFDQLHIPMQLRGALE